MNCSDSYILVVCPNPAIDIFASVAHFEIGVPNRITKEERYPGGKGIHVAMALAEFDIPVRVVGVWGSVSGEWIKSECNRYYPGIRFDGIQVTDWSRSCYTFKSEGNFKDTELLGTGPTLTATEVEQFNLVVYPYLKNAKAVVFSGSWPAGAPSNAYQILIEEAKKVTKTYLDCTGVQLENGLKAKPFGVHLNRKEITEYFRMDFDSAQKELLNFCDVAAITDGARGLYLSTSHETKHQVCWVDQVISTIGSGDCLLAGIVAGYYLNESFETIAKMGAAFGAANCLRKELGMLYREDIVQLMIKGSEVSL